MGKTALINHMLRELEKEGGTSMENTSTVLGAVLQYSEKQSSILENISSLTSFSTASDQTMDLLLGCKMDLKIDVFNDGLIFNGLNDRCIEGMDRYMDEEIG